MRWPRFAAFVVSEGDAGHHIIATSADHSLSLPLLFSLWFFGLFNNHVSSHTVRHLVAHLTQHDRPRSYTICSLELINRGSGILRFAALSSTPAKNSVRVPCPPAPPRFSSHASDIDYSVCRFPLLASSSVFGSWRQVGDALTMILFCPHSSVFEKLFLIHGQGWIKDSRFARSRARAP